MATEISSSLSVLDAPCFHSKDYCVKFEVGHRCCTRTLSPNSKSSLKFQFPQEKLRKKTQKKWKPGPKYSNDSPYEWLLSHVAKLRKFWKRREKKPSPDSKIARIKDPSFAIEALSENLVRFSELAVVMDRGSRFSGGFKSRIADLPPSIWDCASISHLELRNSSQGRHLIRKWRKFHKSCPQGHDSADWIPSTFVIRNTGDCERIRCPFFRKKFGAEICELRFQCPESDSGSAFGLSDREKAEYYKRARPGSLFAQAIKDTLPVINKSAFPNLTSLGIILLDYTLSVYNPMCCVEFLEYFSNKGMIHSLKILPASLYFVRFRRNAILEFFGLNNVKRQPLVPRKKKKNRRKALVDILNQTAKGSRKEKKKSKKTSVSKVGDKGSFDKENVGQFAPVAQKDAPKISEDSSWIGAETRSKTSSPTETSPTGCKKWSCVSRKCKCSRVGENRKLTEGSHTNDANHLWIYLSASLGEEEQKEEESVREEVDVCEEGGGRDQKEDEEEKSPAVENLEESSLGDDAVSSQEKDKSDDLQGRDGLPESSMSPSKFKAFVCTVDEISFSKILHHVMAPHVPSESSSSLSPPATNTQARVPSSPLEVLDLRVQRTVESQREYRSLPPLCRIQLEDELRVRELRVLRLSYYVRGEPLPGYIESFDILVRKLTMCSPLIEDFSLSGPLRDETLMGISIRWTHLHTLGLTLYSINSLEALQRLFGLRGSRLLNLQLRCTCEYTENLLPLILLPYTEESLTSLDVREMRGLWDYISDLEVVLKELSNLRRVAVSGRVREQNKAFFDQMNHLEVSTKSGDESYH